jgi:hypothetical protein
VVALSWFIAVAAVVLGALAAVKLVDPSPTATMLHALEVPGGALTARLMGAVELLVAVVVLSAGPAASVGALAALYFVFAAGLVVLRHRSPTTSCGCIGRLSGPPTVRHMVIDACLGVAALTGVLTSTTAWPDLSGMVTTSAYWLSVMFGAFAVIAALSGPAMSTTPSAGPSTGTLMGPNSTVSNPDDSRRNRN